MASGGITMPTFTPLGSGLPGAPGSDGGLGGGAGDNSLFGSNSLGSHHDSVAAPQFADLGASLGGKPGAGGGLGGGILGGPLGGLDEKRKLSQTGGLNASGMGSGELPDADAEESKKDYSHLLQVFNIYKSKENFNASGFFNGGLDTGIEPSLLAVDFQTKE